MKTLTIIIGAVLLISTFLLGCSTIPQSDYKAKLGQEVSLKVGQSVLIEGKNLHIKFTDVEEDSRCPRNVTCVWQGQAVSSLVITEPDGSIYDLKLIEPGLQDGFSETIFGDVNIFFHLIPYPLNPGEISRDEYRLVLSCHELETPASTEPDVTGFITNIETIATKDIVGRISVESHADKIVDKYVITVNRDTGIYLQQGEMLYNVTFDYLENQQWIKLWIDGPIMESFPMQATAGQIVIAE
jgi:hypothetical protein